MKLAAHVILYNEEYNNTDQLCKVFSFLFVFTRIQITLIAIRLCFFPNQVIERHCESQTQNPNEHQTQNLNIRGKKS